MTLILKIVSWLGLVLTLLPSILFFFDALSLDALKTAMIVGMLLWLVSAPFTQKPEVNPVSDPL